MRGRNMMKGDGAWSDRPVVWVSICEGAWGGMGVGLDQIDHRNSLRDTCLLSILYKNSDVS